MKNKYPCETCDHYRPPFDGDGGGCLNVECYNPYKHESAAHLSARERCRGRFHSAYVSVWRRVWRKIVGVKPKFPALKNPMLADFAPYSAKYETVIANGDFCINCGYSRWQNGGKVEHDCSETKEHVAGSWR